MQLKKTIHPHTLFDALVSPEMQQIAVLKRKIAQSDYKAIKYAEGWISAEDYAPIKAERQAIRDQINALEQQLTLKKQSVASAEEPDNNEPSAE